MSGRPGVFLDRDGTINEEVNFVTRPDELTLIPGAASAIHRLNEHGIPTCVISNQSGVARGYLTEADLVPIHERLSKLLSDEGNARVERIYYCPHHPTEGIAPYNVSCECRKPSPGMLRQGERELGLQLDESFVVGDREVDLQAAGSVGATAILVLTGYGQTTLREMNSRGDTPDHVMPSLPEAVSFILDKIDKDRT